MNHFFDVLLNLPQPVNEFIDQHEIVNNKEPDPILIQSIETALKFLKDILGRTVKTKYFKIKYYVVRGLDFSKSSLSKLKDKTFLEYYKERYQLNIDFPNLPLVQLIKYQDYANSEKELLMKSLQFPKAFNLAHQRLNELNDIRKFYERIPLEGNYEEFHPLIPLEFIYDVPYPRVCGALMHYLMALCYQTDPFFQTRPTITDIVISCNKHLKENFDFSFRNLKTFKNCSHIPNFFITRFSLFSYISTSRISWRCNS